MDEKIIDVEVEETEETIEEPQGIFVKAGVAVQNFVDNTAEMVRNNWKKILFGTAIGAAAGIATGVGIYVAAAGAETDDDYDYDGDLELEVVTEIPTEIEVSDIEESDDSNDN